MELHAYKSEQARAMVIVVADNMIRPGGEPLKACATAIRGNSRDRQHTAAVGAGREVSRYMPR